MAAPAVLGAISIGSTVLGGIMGAKGAKDQGKAQSEALLYQAGISDWNAKINKQNAIYARDAGDTESRIAGQKTAQQVGLIRATQGASGLDVNTGTQLKVQEGQAKVGAADVAQIRANAARRAFGYETEATSNEMQSGLLRQQASNAKKAGKTNAIASILGTAGSVASKWTQAKSVGLFSDSKSEIGYFDNGYDAAPVWR